MTDVVSTLSRLTMVLTYVPKGVGVNARLEPLSGRPRRLPTRMRPKEEFRAPPERGCGVLELLEFH